MRISYYSKITKKPKFKQVNLKNFESEEAAQQFLDKWKVEQIEAEKIKLNNNEQLPIETNIENNDDKIVKIEQITEPPTISKLPDIKKTPFKLIVADTKIDGEGKSTILYGAGNSGKTVLTKYILSTYYDKKEIITTIMSPSINAAKYSKIRKKKNIIKNAFFNEDLIKGVAKIQLRTSNKYPAFCFVMDDIVSDKNSEQVKKMILTYRNRNISSVINLQSMTLLAKNNRFNCNNVLFLRQNNQEAIIEILDCFLKSYPPCDSLPTKDMKVQMYRKLTDKNCFMYLNCLTDELTFHNAVPNNF